MREFYANGKVNFVDVNNVFVGYDEGQSCCEDAGWFIADTITNYAYDMEEMLTPREIEPYSFDKEFFKYGDSSDLDSGAMVIFRLVADDLPDMFLHVYNAHNGYYSHGFVFKDGDTVIQEDYL